MSVFLRLPPLPLRASSGVRPIAHVLGLLMSLFSLLFSLPMVFWLLEDDPSGPAFLKSGLVILGIGLLALLFSRGERRELTAREGFLLVSLSWLVLATVSALPFWLFFPELGFTAAFFEAVSGITTTGATVLTGLDTMSRGILFWRGLLQWVGGMGILVLALAVLPLLGVGGMQIFKAETPGVMKDSKLTPRIASTAKLLWGFYCLLTLACFAAYWLAGMDWFDALVHAGTTVSLGGLANYDSSFAAFNSAAIEAVAIGFMLLCMLNFAVGLVALRSVSLSPYRHCPEARYSLGVVLLGVTLVWLILILGPLESEPLLALRQAAFNVVSIASTTGFSTVDYSLWPIAAPYLMLLLAVVASSSGSTGGGIKMIRLVLMVKQTRREMLRMIHPRAVDPVRLGESAVPHQVTFAMVAYLFLFGATVIVVSLLLMASGMSEVEAVPAVIAMITNMGPGMYSVGPAGNYAAQTDFQLALLSMTMLLGRLELLTLFVLAHPGFWRD